MSSLRPFTNLRRVRGAQRNHNLFVQQIICRSNESRRDDHRQSQHHEYPALAFAMPSFFSRLKGKDGPSKVSKKKGAQHENVDVAPPKPRWEDAWTRNTVDPEEVQELLRGCTLELKSRGMEDDFPLSIMQRAIAPFWGSYTS